MARKTGYLQYNLLVHCIASNRKMQWKGMLNFNSQGERPVRREVRLYDRLLEDYRLLEDCRLMSISRPETACRM